MATEVASAYVSIGASTKGMGRAISKEFAGVEGRADKVSSSVSSKIIGAIGNVTKVAAGAVAIVGTALGGLALKGGFDRALALDNANAKMVALGYSAKDIESVMDSALNSVKGTAFGLGDAASLASQFLAGGVEMGEDLDRALQAAADSAAVANVPLSDMQQVFGQLASGSQLYTQDLLQLQSRGLPVFSWLADSMDVSVDKVREMVSAGELGFEDFQKAVEENIGGAAKNTDSFAASWSNTKAALSRGGAVFAIPALATLKDLLDAAIPAIDTMATAIEPLVEAFFEKIGPGVERAKDALESFAEGDFDFKSMLPKFDVGEFLSDLVPKIQQGIQKAADWLADGGIQMLADGFISGRQALFQAVLDIVPGVIDALETIIPALGDLVIQIVTALVEFVPLVVDTLVTMAPALMEVATTLFGTLLDALVTIIPQVLTTLAQALPQIVNSLMEMAPGLLLGAMEAFTALIEALGVVIPELLTVLTEEVLPQLIDSFVTMGPPLVDAAIVAFMALVTALTDVLPILLDALLNDVLPAVIDLLIANAPELLLAAIQMWGAIQTALVMAVPKILRALWDMLWSIVKSQLNMTSKLAEAAKTMFQGMLDGSREKFADVLAWVREIPKRIKNMFANAGNWLVSAGKAILNGLLRGIRAGFKPVEDALRWVTDKIPDWKGPAERDADILVGAGRLVMGGFGDGLQDGMGAIKRQLQGFTSDLAVAGSVDVNGMAAGAASGLNRSDLDYLADRIARLMGLESERGTSRAFTDASRATDLSLRMG